MQAMAMEMSSTQCSTCHTSHSLRRMGVMDVSTMAPRKAKMSHPVKTW